MSELRGKNRAGHFGDPLGFEDDIRREADLRRKQRQKEDRDREKSLEEQYKKNFHPTGFDKHYGFEPVKWAAEKEERRDREMRIRAEIEARKEEHIRNQERVQLEQAEKAREQSSGELFSYGKAVDSQSLAGRGALDSPDRERWREGNRQNSASYQAAQSTSAGGIALTAVTDTHAPQPIVASSSQASGSGRSATSDPWANPKASETEWVSAAKAAWQEAQREKTSSYGKTDIEKVADSLGHNRLNHDGVVLVDSKAELAAEAAKLKSGANPDPNSQPGPAMAPEVSQAARENKLSRPLESPRTSIGTDRVNDMQEKAPPPVPVGKASIIKENLAGQEPINTTAQIVEMSTPQRPFQKGEIEPVVVNTESRLSVQFSRGSLVVHESGDLYLVCSPKRNEVICAPVEKAEQGVKGEGIVNIEQKSGFIAIRCDRLATIDSTQIVRTELEQVKPETIQKVNQALMVSLGLTSAAPPIENVEVAKSA